MVKLVALGRYAEDDSLQRGHDVVVYFARAQKPKDVEKAWAHTLWIFSDAYVHVVATKQAKRAVTKEIVLKH